MQPKTKDNLNFTLYGCKVEFLTVDDQLRPDDLVRDLYESPMYSQDGGWDTTYKPEIWRGTFWHKVETELPAWVDKTYRDYLEFCRDKPDHEASIEHEIVRIIK